MKQTMSPVVASSERHSTSPLPGTGGQPRQDVVAVHDPGAGRRGDLGGAVGGAGVQHHQLVDERERVGHQVAADHRDDRADRRLLVRARAARR